MEEYGTVWAFFYNTREYIETLDVRHALAGNGALVIPKSGEEPFAVLEWANCVGSRRW